MSEPDSSVRSLPPPAPWLVGGGEVGEQLRTKDWSGTALGPLDAWPSSLRTALNLCLALPSAVLILWGPERRMFYNEGFRSLCGERHARLLGEPITEYWGPAWPALRDVHERAFAGQSATFDAQHVFVDHGRGPEETYLGGSLAPLRDERGDVRGLWMACTPMTAQVLEERRTRVLREVTQGMAQARTLEELFVTAAHALGSAEQDLPWVRIYYQETLGGPYRRVVGTDREDEGTWLESLPEGLPRTPCVLRVEELGRHPRPLHAGPYPEPLRQVVLLPITLPGEDAPIALLLAGVSTRLALNEDYLAFYRLLAGTVSALAIQQQVYRPPRGREPHVSLASSLESFALLSPRASSTLLLVEGDPGSREGLCDLLTQQGWRVEAVGDGHQALEAARLRMPDLILTNLELPRLDGLGLLHHLREQPATRTTPFLIYSARTEPHLRRDCLARGADDYLEKPLAPRELLARLRYQMVRILMRHVLRVHRHQLYQLVDHVPSSIAIVRGPEHVFDFVNKNFQALVPHQTFLGRRARDICTYLEGQGIFEVLDEVYRTGVPFTGREVTLHLDVNNTGQAQEVIVHFTCQPLRDFNGRIEGVVSAHLDITGLVKSRRREEQRAAELEAIIDSIPDGVCIADASGHVRTNRMEPELLRSSGIEEALQEALRGEAFTRDIYLPQQDTGRYRVIRSATAPVRLREAIVGAVSINMDITERKRTEEEREVLLANEQAARGDAERANRKKDEFLARVSHELATPLVGMRLWLDLLRSDSSHFEEASAALTQCIQTQSRIVHDLLDTARALSGKLSVALEACEPAEPIQAAVQDLRPLALQKGVTLEMFLGETSLILADPKRMQQVMSNLLSNAVKFTPRGGRVDVRLMQDSSGVCIIVEDTGRGFPPEFRPMLFAPFRQEEESTTRANGGLGLGLSIVRQLVELQGGTVWAESPGRDRGATFTVWLPAQEEPLEDAFLEDERGGDLQLKGLRLLLVEDDDITRTAMVALLERHGAHVKAEQDAPHALATLKRGGFDALVCDIAMPGEDGLSLIRKIRVLEGPPSQIPAAAFSAHMREEDRLQALMAGFQMYIPKSVETRQLIQQIQALVDTPPVEG